MRLFSSMKVNYYKYSRKTETLILAINELVRLNKVLLKKGIWDSISLRHPWNRIGSWG
jgi:hypothetical protein